MSMTDATRRLVEAARKWHHAPAGREAYAAILALAAEIDAYEQALAAVQAEEEKMQENAWALREAEAAGFVEQAVQAEEACPHGCEDGKIYVGKEFQERSACAIDPCPIHGGKHGGDK